jgi:hypothetical protein
MPSDGSSLTIKQRTKNKVNPPADHIGERSLREHSEQHPIAIGMVSCAMAL